MSGRHGAPKGNGAPTGNGVTTNHHVGWSELGDRARLWRLGHAAWSVAQLAALGYIFACVVSGRRDRKVWASVGFLTLEGAALVVGGGDCPVGPLQQEWGDPVPFFELLLPPRAAKAAIPVLAVVSLSAMGLLIVRRPGLVIRA
jgi:hypothetical protein